MDLFELLKQMWLKALAALKPIPRVTINGIERPRAVNASEAWNMVFIYSSAKALEALTGGAYTFDGPWGVTQVDPVKMDAAGWKMDEGWRKAGIHLHVAMLNYGRHLDGINELLWADGLIPGNKIDPEKMKAAGWRLGKGDEWYLDWARDYAEGTGYYILQVPTGGPRAEIYRSYESLYGKPWDGVTYVGMPTKYVEPLDEDIDR